MSKEEILSNFSRTASESTLKMLLIRDDLPTPSCRNFVQ